MSIGWENRQQNLRNLIERAKTYGIKVYLYINEPRAMPVSLVSDDELSADYILPKAFDKRVGETVAKAVSEATIKKSLSCLKIIIKNVLLLKECVFLFWKRKNE